MASPRLIENTRPLCKTCQKEIVVIHSKKTKLGFPVYTKFCHKCHYKKYGRRGKRVDSKKDHCEFCGFSAIDPCQLDVDHKDGNRKNNNPENWQTLCANCHRLKTKQQKEGYYGTPRPKRVEQTPMLS